MTSADLKVALAKATGRYCVVTVRFEYVARTAEIARGLGWTVRNVWTQHGQDKTTNLLMENTPP